MKYRAKPIPLGSQWAGLLNPMSASHWLRAREGGPNRPGQVSTVWLRPVLWRSGTSVDVSGQHSQQWPGVVYSGGALTAFTILVVIRYRLILKTLVNSNPDDHSAVESKN